MSWSRRCAGVLAGLGAALPLAGCFTPLYGSLNGGLGTELEAIAVDPIPDQLGHYLRDRLLTDLNGTGSSPTPKYHLAVKPHERVQSALVDVQTGRAQAATVVIDTDYVLTAVGVEAPLAKGTVTSAATFCSSGSE